MAEEFSNEVLHQILIRVEENVGEIKTDVNLYKLDDNVLEVRDIYQRSTGGVFNNGVEFEPFGAQYINTLLGPLASGRGGGLATYDFLAQHLELIGLLFGYEFQYTWTR